MMQLWSPDAVDFMRDASEFGDYYERLADVLMRWLPPDGHICDAGCGLGYLSQSLAGRCRQVTAIDCSKAAVSALQTRPHAENLICRCADLLSDDIAVRYDAMVFCYFGRFPEIMYIARKQCKGKVIIVKRDCSEHRFSLGTVQRHTDIMQVTQDLLAQHAIPYERETISLELGQPFRSIEDAIRFFGLYNCGNAEISPEAVRKRLIPIDCGAYRWYLPERRKMGILVINAVDIPDLFANRELIKG